MIGLFLTVTIVSVANFVLYIMNQNDNKSIENDINHLVYEKKELERRIRLLEARHMNQKPSEKIEIVYTPDNVNAPKYGGF